VRSPVKRRSDGAERAIEKPAHIVDEGEPALRRHVAGRAIGVEPGETISPSARNTAVVLDDRGALFLAVAPVPPSGFRSGG
jgi:hypothetical protein